MRSCTTLMLVCLMAVFATFASAWPQFMLPGLEIRATNGTNSTSSSTMTASGTSTASMSSTSSVNSEAATASGYPAGVGTGSSGSGESGGTGSTNTTTTKSDAVANWVNGALLSSVALAGAIGVVFSI